MLRQNINALRTANFVLDLVTTLAALFLSAEGYRWFKGETISPLDWALIQYQQAMLVVAIWSVLLQLRNEPYTYRLKTAWSLVRETISLVAYGAAGLLLVSYLLRIPLLPRFQFALFVVLDCAGLAALCVAMLKALHFHRSRGRNCRRVLIVGTRECAAQVIDSLCERKQWGYRPLGMILLDPPQTHYRYRDIPLVGMLGDFADIVKTHSIDEVIFAVPSRFLGEVKAAIAICHETGLTACLQLDLPPTEPMRCKISHFAGKPAVIYSREPEADTALLLKTIADRALGVVGLLLTLPLMILIAVVIKLTSRGPILFRQVRCGLRGKPFRMLKFRTMVVGAESLKQGLLSDNEMDGHAFKIKNDPRVTKVGRFLRRLSLDELPQLINVVKGDMSLVGPRPSLPTEVSEYDLWQRRRLSMKPGITCLWQVGKRNDATFDEWMRQDLEYIDHWSLWLDAKVLARTVPAVIKATGR